MKFLISVALLIIVAGCGQKSGSQSGVSAIQSDASTSLVTKNNLDQLNALPQSSDRHLAIHFDILKAADEEIAPSGIQTCLGCPNPIPALVHIGGLGSLFTQTDAPAIQDLDITVTYNSVIDPNNCLAEAVSALASGESFDFTGDGVLLPYVDASLASPSTPVSSDLVGLFSSGMGVSQGIITTQPYQSPDVGVVLSKIVSCASGNSTTCTPIECAAPPAGCAYSNPEYDGNGCATSCGSLVCSVPKATPTPVATPAPSPTVCQTIECPLVPLALGCFVTPGTTDASGCPTDCGTVSCIQQTSTDLGTFQK